MAIFSDAPYTYESFPVDCRSKDQREHDRIRERSMKHYDTLISIFEDFKIPFSVEETNDSTIISWDDHIAILKYWISPFHTWKDSPMLINKKG